MKLGLHAFSVLAERASRKVTVGDRPYKAIPASLDCLWYGDIPTTILESLNGSLRVSAV